jgi:hypothetical protein
MLGIVTNMLQLKHMMFAHNDDPMQIDKTWFKPFTEHEKHIDV